jgi:putative endonuclease
MADDRRQAFGRRGEQLAATHLERHGWRIVERNFRTREGEIDLIAARKGTLAFCEVKTLVRRRGPPSRGPADPVESVGPAKRSRVRRMARAWLAQARAGDRASPHRCVRLDVIGVLLAPDGSLLRLDHVESAF